MDKERFDDLVKRITAARITRKDALRGLAGAAVAVSTGAAVGAGEAAAKGKKGRKGKVKAQQNGNGDQVTICHCPPGNPDNCHTITVGAKAAAAHLKNHPDDTEGACEEATTTTPEVTTTTAEVTTTTGEPTTTTGEVTTTTSGVTLTSKKRKSRGRRHK